MAQGREGAARITVASMLLALAMTGSACQLETDFVATGRLEREQDADAPGSGMSAGDAGGPADDMPFGPPADRQDAGAGAVTSVAECDVAGVLEEINAPPFWLTVLVDCGGSVELLTPPAPDPHEALRQLLEEPPIEAPAPGSLGEYICERGDVLYPIQFGLAGTLCPEWCAFLRETTLLQIASQCGDWALFAERAAALSEILPERDDDAGMP